MPYTLTTLSKNIHTIALGILLVLCTSSPLFSQTPQNQKPKTNTVFDDLDTSAAASTAREAEIAKLQKEIEVFIDQLADLDLYLAASQTRKLGKNATLIDSMNVYYNNLGIDFLTISNMNNQELWARLWSSAKAYSVNGRIDTTKLTEQTARQVVFRIKVDSTTSMQEFSIRTNIQFSNSFTQLLADEGIQGLEQEINQYLNNGINKLLKPTADGFKPDVIESMSWMYQYLLKNLPPALVDKLLKLKEKEENTILKFPLVTQNYLVNFKKSDLPNYPTVYGFDASDNKTWLNKYQCAVTGDNKVYFIPHVACELRNSTQTYLKATFINNSGNGKTIDSLDFLDNQGRRLKPVFVEGNNAYFAITTESAQNYLVALDKGEPLGKVNIRAFHPIEEELVLITLNNQPLPLAVEEVEKGLNLIYQQGIASWKVSTKNLNTLLHIDGVEHPKDEGLDQYSEGMKSLRNQYFNQQGKPNSKQHLVFIVPAFLAEDGAPIASWQGYMPRGRALGFVTTKSFEGNDVVQKVSTLAHELGHGAFGLEHSWQDAKGGAQGTTHNLMDYSHKTHLIKHQWVEIRKTHAFTYGDDIDDGASVSSDCDDYDPLLYCLNGSMSGIPKDAKVVYYKENGVKRVICFETNCNGASESYFWDFDKSWFYNKNNKEWDAHYSVDIFNEMHEISTSTYNLFQKDTWVQLDIQVQEQGGYIISISMSLYNFVKSTPDRFQEFLISENKFARVFGDFVHP